MVSIFRTAFLVTFAGLATCALLGSITAGGLPGALRFLIIGLVLIILEVSLSFDNAIVNANKLKALSPAWRRRFLTWGIFIAVFGMRIVFPIAVVAIAGHLGPIDAVQLALFQPSVYATVMEDAHISISAFGGTYLMMVALTFFIDDEKAIDWLAWPERGLRAAANVRGMEITAVLIVAVSFALIQDGGQQGAFLIAAILGLIAYRLVEAAGNLLDRWEAGPDIARQAGLGGFLYLEMLDASFSFDGVIGAFALTENALLIALGLGVGAFYVRSFTVMLVENETLADSAFVEHGAFYSVFVLAILMLLQSVVVIPEFVTGLLSVILIGASIVSSLVIKRKCI
ncbi:DUF475 domain-containing protein [Pararhizobium mangrovi]|uniref:DUF475 domain-containing protein n=1 Tax=Pararhizobium mangrovi TaxID=2590452 RepID=A0A506UI03_9HYPH|nr:DUF475 domain-containing protein [Pararhizobium mangrovi]TPW32955.1 DUF475 domain-containing protein [Pararhizobium mangrovi]